MAGKKGKGGSTGATAYIASSNLGSGHAAPDFGMEEGGKRGKRGEGAQGSLVIPTPRPRLARRPIFKSRTRKREKKKEEGGEEGHSGNVISCQQKRRFCRHGASPGKEERKEKKEIYLPAVHPMSERRIVPGGR